MLFCPGSSLELLERESPDDESTLDNSLGGKPAPSAQGLDSFEDEDAEDKDGPAASALLRLLLGRYGKERPNTDDVDKDHNRVRRGASSSSSSSSSSSGSSSGGAGGKSASHSTTSSQSGGNGHSSSR